MSGLQTEQGRAEHVNDDDDDDDECVSVSSNAALTVTTCQTHRLFQPQDR